MLCHKFDLSFFEEVADTMKNLVLLMSWSCYDYLGMG